MSHTNFLIGDRKVCGGVGGDCYLIAEVGVNFVDIATARQISLLDAARLMIKEAAGAGAQAVKFQAYKAELLASRKSPAYWDLAQEPTRSQYELFKKFDVLEYTDYRALAKFARSQNIDFICTPFDNCAVEVLSDVVVAFKVASADITNAPLIRHVARCGKPLIISTGASFLSEIFRAVEWIEDEGNRNIAIMHCVLSYPTRAEEANLAAIKTMMDRFPEYLIGYSDHVVPDETLEVLKTAYLLGANVIEKHFTLDKTLKGNDHYHAMDTHDIARFQESIGSIRRSLGSGEKSTNASEVKARLYARRSVVASEDIRCGDMLGDDNLTTKRPGTGIPAELWDSVKGKRALVDIKADTILSWDMVGEQR